MHPGWFLTPRATWLDHEASSHIIVGYNNDHCSKKDDSLIYRGQIHRFGSFPQHFQRWFLKAVHMSRAVNMQQLAVMAAKGSREARLLLNMRKQAVQNQDEQVQTHFTPHPDDVHTSSSVG